MERGPNTAELRYDLGMLMQEYIETDEGFISDIIFPYIGVPNETATYDVEPIESILHLAKDDTRALFGSYKGSDSEYEVGFYGTVDRGRAKRIDDRQLARARVNYPTLNMETILISKAANELKRSREKRVADKTFDPIAFTPTSVSNPWDDLANALPISDINMGKLKFVEEKLGMLPDTLLITQYTYLKLREVEQVVDLLKYTFPGIQINSLRPDQLAEIFDVPRVVVAGARYNSAHTGQEAVISQIWDKEYAALIRTSNSPDLTEPCFGRTFVWNEVSSSLEPQVRMIRDDKNKHWFYDVSYYLNEELIRSYEEDRTTVKSDIADNCILLFDNISA